MPERELYFIHVHVVFNRKDICIHEVFLFWLS